MWCLFTSLGVSHSQHACASRVRLDFILTVAFHGVALVRVQKGQKAVTFFGFCFLAHGDAIWLIPDPLLLLQTYVLGISW